MRRGSLPSKCPANGSEPSAIEIRVYLVPLCVALAPSHHVVRYVTPEHHIEIGIIKDTASAAVFYTDERRTAKTRTIAS